MEMREFFERAELFDRRGLLERRSGWTDRLPGSIARVIAAGTKRSRWHWSLILPAPLVERYRLWLARQRYRLDIEQINIDEIDDLPSMVEDTSEVMRAIQEKHAIRRQMARFHVASRERVILERLARRWDVDAPRMIDRGNVNERANRAGTPRGQRGALDLAHAVRATVGPCPESPCGARRRSQVTPRG